MSDFYLGTSGWHYKHWHETFYPPDWPKAKQLEFYQQKFNSVEINATFYRLPSEKTVQGWAKRASKNFRYAVKGSRLVTHLKRLKEVDKEVDVFIRRIEPLKPRMGPILWQLPPSLKRNDTLLGDFLEILPKQFRHVVEFRHVSWLDDAVYQQLSRAKVCLAWISSNILPMHFETTTDFVYVRFHGLEGGAAHDYTDAELEPWAEHLSAELEREHPAYAYFNNDWNTRAPENAMRLREMVQAGVAAH